VLAHEQAVRDRREDLDDAAHRGRVERDDGEVREDDGAVLRPIEKRREPSRLHGRIGPAHEGLVEEDARVLGQLAPALVADAAARAEHHPLRAARSRDVARGLHRSSLPAPPPPKPDFPRRKSGEGGNDSGGRQR
jgi:hypothetical protein